MPKKRRKPTRLLTREQMATEKGVKYGRSQLRRMWEANPPLFPAPIFLSAKKMVWAEYVVDDWIAARVAAPNERRFARDPEPPQKRASAAMLKKKKEEEKKKKKKEKGRP